MAKNSEVYKTAQERAEAFEQFCGSFEDCKKGCPLNCEDKYKESWCNYAWLDLEAEEEKPLPCIWCGHETYVCEGQNYGQVRCKNCMAEGPATDSMEHAIRNYNRVAKAINESEVK